ncbi:MAG: site-specific integrase [Rikenellaceae bacterium]|nr:site-specific integrase [Rikenellaceae bacterium]
MTTFKFHYRPPGNKGRSSGKLFIRIIHGRRYRDLGRDYPIRPQEWDEGAGWLRFPPDPDPSGCERLRDIEAAMRADLMRLEGVVNRLRGEGDYTVGMIVGQFHKTGDNDTVLSFALKLAHELHHERRLRTARAYRSAAKSIVRFNGGRDMLLCELDAVRLGEYERHLLDRGLQMNTVSFYMRNLRAIYYRAVSAGIISRRDTNPFENVYTGVYETRRRSLDQRDMKSLAALGKELPSQRLQNALSYFMFAYHARGMSFIDVAHLKKSDIKHGSIIYRRKKTGFYIEVKITKPMKKIVDRYLRADDRSAYLSPILDPAHGDINNQYETALNRQNRNLKELAELAGIKKNISTHVARHTWATLAKRLGYGISLISEGLGHRDSRITSIYLASFEPSTIDALSVRLSKAVATA